MLPNYWLFKLMLYATGRMFHGKPLYVAFAQRKDVRQSLLQLQHTQKPSGLAGASTAVTPGAFSPIIRTGVVYHHPMGSTTFYQRTHVSGQEVLHSDSISAKVSVIWIYFNNQEMIPLLIGVACDVVVETSTNQDIWYCNTWFLTSVIFLHDLFCRLQYISCLSMWICSHDTYIQLFQFNCEYGWYDNIQIMEISFVFEFKCDCLNCVADTYYTTSSYKNFSRLCLCPAQIKEVHLHYRSSHLH